MRDVRLGIDIGSETIKFVATEPQKRGGRPPIIRVGSFPVLGFRAGHIVDPEKFRSSIRAAMKQFLSSHSEGLNILSSHLALSGSSLNSRKIRSKQKIHSEDIQQQDIEKLEETAEKHFLDRFPNERSGDYTPLRFTLDGEAVEGNPAGMFAEEIEAEYLFVSFLDAHYEALTYTLEDIFGAPLDTVVISPLAEAQASLLYRQKMQGVALVNIGSEITTLSLFQNGLLQAVRVIPIASGHITNDIALAFQVSLAEAEKIKRGKKETAKRKVQQIIEARLEDIAEILLKELKDGRKKKYLPAGLVLTGGGANIPSIEEFFREKLLFPVEGAKIYKENPAGTKKTLVDPAFVSAYGACFSGGRKRYNKWGVRKLITKFRHLISQMKP